jgi:phosphoribosylformylglycinamidine cyclo-ligase
VNEKGLSYSKAGVDIDRADQAIRMISPLVKATRRPEVLSDLEGFAGFFRLDVAKYPRPVLLSGTDGVGTKLKIAQMTGIHDTVGIDLVAMCVNDVLVHGAEPLFFLDYLAVGRVEPEKIARIVEGIASGCKESGMALIGGETAEMPGFYGPEEYDLAGFAVGVANEDRIITGREIKGGDVVLGLASSGIHSNGYSLVRKIIFDQARLDLDQFLDPLGRTIGEELLVPTRIYVRSILDLLTRVPVKAMAHITGGGIPENLKRVIPPGLEARIQTSAWPRPPVFALLQELGGVESPEMFRTFNMGVGFMIVVAPAEADHAVVALEQSGETVYILGEIAAGDRGVAIDW